MCLAIPAKVVELFPGERSRALVEVTGVRRHIDIGLLEDDPPQAGRLGAGARRLRHEQDQRRTGARSITDADHARRE